MILRLVLLVSRVVAFTSPLCANGLITLTENETSGTISAPSDFSSTDCQWFIRTDNVNRSIELTIVDFFINARPPFCQNAPGFPLINRNTGRLFACEEVGIYCDYDIVKIVCPVTCGLCDTCNFNYVEVRGTDNTLYFHDCQSISLPLTLDVGDSVLIQTTRGWLANYDPEFLPSTDRLQFSFKVFDRSNHSHPNVSLCSGRTEFFHDNGTFTDGSAPAAMYQPNANCEWVISAPAGMFVQLSFDQFDLQRALQDPQSPYQRCSYDRVLVLDGSPGVNGTHTAVLGEFCGSDLPPVITSTGQNLTVQFSSDSSVAGKGFTVRWIFVSVGSNMSHCNGTLVFDGVEGDITVSSPAGGGDCVWSVLPPPDKFVRVEFVTQSLQPYQPSCQADVITITENASKVLQRSCDVYLPPPVVSTTAGANVTIAFKADFESAEIFHFKWSFVTTNGTDPSPCESNKPLIAWTSNDTGVINDGTRYGQAYADYVRCGWTITSPPGTLVRLDYQYFSVEPFRECGYDSVTVSSGGDFGRDVVLQKACGTRIPAHVLSLNNKMYIEFNSDESVGYDGFSVLWSVVAGVLPDAPCGGEKIIDATVSTSGALTDGRAGFSQPSNCTWIIRTLPGKFVQLSVSNTTLAPRTPGFGTCDDEYLAVWDGPTSDSYLQWKACGAEIPPICVSTSSQTRVAFVSKGAQVVGSFNLSWTVVNSHTDNCTRWCYGTVALPASSEINGTISTFIVGEVYRPDTSCFWTITAPPGKFVQLTWIQFALQEPHFGTCLDFVSVRDGISGDNELQNSCGEGIPGQANSRGREMSIYFGTNSNVQNWGWTASWQFVDTPGPGTCFGTANVTHNGDITDGSGPWPYTSDANCTWNILAPIGQRINITMLELKLQKDNGTGCPDFLAFLDADRWRQFCGTLNDRELQQSSFVSSSNTLQIRFFSDRSVVDAGFLISVAFVNITSPDSPQETGSTAVIVTAVLLSVFGLVLLGVCAYFLRHKMAQRKTAHIDLDRGQELPGHTAGTQEPPSHETTTGAVPI